VKASGALAEARAEAHLAAHGLAVVERNWRCRFGEIDLIAKDGETLVFVEVRSRTSTAFGGALASIDAAKQRRLAAAARQYLARSGADVPCRFDAVLIEHDGRIEWLRDAFDAP